MWLFFALLTALFESLKDLQLKRSAANFDALALAWHLIVYSLPFLLPFALFGETANYSAPEFWLALVSAGIAAGGSLGLLCQSGIQRRSVHRNPDACLYPCLHVLHLSPDDRRIP